MPRYPGGNPARRILQAPLVPHMPRGGECVMRTVIPLCPPLTWYPFLFRSQPQRATARRNRRQLRSSTSCPWTASRRRPRRRPQRPTPPRCRGCQVRYCSLFGRLVPLCCMLPAPLPHMELWCCCAPPDERSCLTSPKRSLGLLAELSVVQAGSVMCLMCATFAEPSRLVGRWRYWPEFLAGFPCRHTSLHRLVCPPACRRRPPTFCPTAAPRDGLLIHQTSARIV